MKIGVFDSGVGGITVLKELRKQFPGHEYLYFGDTANVPYGTKSPTQIQSLVTSASERMKTQGIEALVIACNTASSLAFQQFKNTLSPMPILDVVEAGVKSVTDALASKSTPILILGTRATVRSRIYSTLLKKIDPNYRIFEQECPLLVPLIEEGWIHHPVMELTVQEYVRPYQTLEPGVALLACTHYPWIKEGIEKCLPQWTVIDSAKALAQIAEQHLQLSTLSHQSSPAPMRWYFSDPDSIARNVLDEIYPAPSKF